MSTLGYMHHVWHVAALILALAVLWKQDDHEWYKGSGKGGGKRSGKGGGKGGKGGRRPNTMAARGGRVFDLYKRSGSGSATRRVPPGGGRVFDLYKRPSGRAG